MITYEEQINQFKADFHLAQDELDDIIKIHEIPIFIEYKRDDIHDFTDKPSLYEELVYIIEGKSYDKPGIEEKYKHRSGDWFEKSFRCISTFADEHDQSPRLQVILHRHENNLRGSLSPMYHSGK